MKMTSGRRDREITGQQIGVWLDAACPWWVNLSLMGNIMRGPGSDLDYHSTARSVAMSFGLYLAGFVLVIAGTAWALSLAHVPTVWIAVVSVILLGLGMVKGVGKTRTKDQ